VFGLVHPFLLRLAYARQRVSIFNVDSMREQILSLTTKCTTIYGHRPWPHPPYVVLQEKEDLNNTVRSPARGQSSDASFSGLKPGSAVNSSPSWMTTCHDCERNLQIHFEAWRPRVPGGTCLAASWPVLGDRQQQQGKNS